MGRLFRDARIKAGLEIHHIAKVLKIRQQYLVAIENGEDYIIPGQVYVYGYKKLYANYLGINLEDALASKKNIRNAKPHSQFLFKKKYADKLLVPASFILVFIVIYCWQSLTNEGPINLIDDLTSGAEKYIDNNFTFPYAKEYNLQNTPLLEASFRNRPNIESK